MEIIENIGRPALQLVNSLVGVSGNWDITSRNDFCRSQPFPLFLFLYEFKNFRYLLVCRSILLGLPTFLKERTKNVVNPCVNDEHEVPALIVNHLDVTAGFALSDSRDPRYQKALNFREEFGHVILAAAASLRRLTGGEDHTDAVIGVTKAIDVYLLSYAVTRGDFDSLQKSYAQARE